MTDEHWGCADNEERSPFDTRRASCDGPVTARRGAVFVFGTAWRCDKHWQDYDARD